ncbi:MAG: MaoC family dehydratase [Pseudomonadota bacterium]
MMIMMNQAAFDTVQVGDKPVSFTLPPLSRLTLALYCGASGDHNPLHVDIDFARSSGMPDVIAHGMLSMAYLGRLMTDWVPQSALRELSTRFSEMTHVGDELTCVAEIIGKMKTDGEPRARLKLTVTDQRGGVKLQGEAVVALA